MISVIGPRGTGKTTKLFELARENNAIILAPNSRGLREKAKSMDYKDIEIIGYGQLKNDDFSFGKPILVDNADQVLQMLLDKYYNLNVIGFAATVEDK